jgi:hypothetical protein
MFLRTNRPARIAILGLATFCVMMAGLQWLVGPARGARDLAYDLKQGEHPAVATMLLRVVNSELLRMADVGWQLHVNFPRNWLLTKAAVLSFPEQADLFSWAHQTKPWRDLAYSIALIVGSLLVYGPVVVLIAQILQRRHATTN